MNKQASETSMKPILELILVAILIIVVAWGLYKFGIIEYLKGLPDFNQTEYGKKIIVEQEAIPEKEKARGFTSDGSKAPDYPMVRLYYTGKWNIDDFLAFRWNPTEKKVQVVINIRRWNDLKGEESKEWLINPDLNELFLEQKGIDANQKEDVIKIIKSKSEEEMIKKIAEASKKEDVDIDFPISRWEASEGFERGHKSEMNEKEVKHKLMQYYPEFYREDIKKAIEEGEEFTSDELVIYFNDGWWDGDEFVVRWNFAKQKPEIILRPDEEKILENGQEIYVDNFKEIKSFLEKYKKSNDISDKDLVLIENLFTTQKPSELSSKIKEILDLDRTYTIAEKTKAKNEDLGLIDINGRLYGYGKNPDELFKIEEEENVEE